MWTWYSNKFGIKRVAYWTRNMQIFRTHLCDLIPYLMWWDLREENTERNYEKNMTSDLLLYISMESQRVVSGIILAWLSSSFRTDRVHWRALIAVPLGTSIALWRQKVERREQCVSVRHPFEAAVKAILSELTPRAGFGVGQQAEVSLTEGTCFPGTVFGAPHLTWRNSQSSVSGN